uniref:Uncharacterized protein n=1 Tax=Cacopsylla melanoneura TaxID=428564 RepID=A0A8D9B1D1_9HEMI
MLATWSVERFSCNAFTCFHWLRYSVCYSVTFFLSWKIIGLDVSPCTKLSSLLPCSTSFPCTSCRTCSSNSAGPLLTTTAWVLPPPLLTGAPHVLKSLPIRQSLTPSVPVMDQHPVPHNHVNPGRPNREITHADNILPSGGLLRLVLY